MTYAVYTENVNTMVDKETKAFIVEQAKKRKVAQSVIVRELLEAGRNVRYPKRTSR